MKRIILFSIAIIGINAGSLSQAQTDKQDAKALFSQAVQLEQDNDFKKAKTYYKKSCDGNFMQACNNLATLYANGNGMLFKNYRKARKLYQKACESNFPGHEHACGNLGELYRQGFGVKKDPDKAAELFRQACEAGNMDRCDQLKPNQFDSTKLISSLQKSCDEGHGPNCRSLGHLYKKSEFREQSTYADIKPDDAKAYDAFLKACNAGLADGCGYAGLVYEQSENLKQDFSAIADLYQKACDGESSIFCGHLGIFYENGLGGLKQDFSKAANLYKIACEEDQTTARNDFCGKLGILYYEGKGLEQNFVKAVSLLEESCRFGETSCFYLGNLYFKDQDIEQNLLKAALSFKKGCFNGHGDQRSCAKKEELYQLMQESCDQHNKIACQQLGIVHYEDGQYYCRNSDEELRKHKEAQHCKQASEAYTKGCNLDDAYSCYKLAEMYDDILHSPVGFNQAKAIDLYHKSCESGIGEACYKLGNHYQYEKNIPEAIKAYEKGCNPKEYSVLNHSCSSLKELKK